MAARHEARPLAAYRKKRSADRTPEPFDSGVPRPHLFVVQEHQARRRHFDLRLEWNGVLLSWAVPKGPSLDPAEKRLAVQVEDHPTDYADFEGSIPEGNYGAGAVIVWDKGRWQPVEDPARGLESGKLLFDLFGYKLRGRFTLVRTRRRGAREPSNEWLLIKKPDAFATSDVPSALSVHSGLDVAARAAGVSLEPALVQEAAEAGATRMHVSIDDVQPMLATPWPDPFASPEWLFEIKYDGYRALAARDGDRVRIVYRSGREATARYPEIASALAALPVGHAIFDGELVVAGPDGRPSFAGLQNRARVNEREAARAAVATPATYWIFDLLALGDLDLRPLPLGDRKSLLARLVPPLGPLRLAPHWVARGTDVYREIERLGFEGMLAKRIDAPYRGRRDAAWRKIRASRTADFAIVGMSPQRGARTGFGALHLAARDGASLRYVGRVGSGLGEQQLRALEATLARDLRETPACTGNTPKGRGNRWVEPRLLAEVRFVEWTPDRQLRQPVFLRVRDDVPIAACEAVPDAAPEADPEPALAPLPEVETGVNPATREVNLTNLDKLFWPAEGLTKGDLIAYYRAISRWMLPYLADRPLVMTRHPDGIEGKSFFQKDAPSWAPGWLRTVTLYSEQSGRDIHYFVCEDADALAYVANMGAIALHVWSSRVARIAKPDWCVLDIDPKGAPFAGAVAIARSIHAIADAIALPHFIKTSGSEGLHVLIPLGGRMTFQQARQLAEAIGRVVVAELPDIATLERQPRKRAGKVYIDTLQNGHGKLLVAPFSVRALPGAPVSMPLRWSEVNARLDPRRFTLRNAVARMRRLGDDPLRQVLGPAPEFSAALGRLSERLRTSGV